MVLVNPLVNGIHIPRNTLGELNLLHWWLLSILPYVAVHVEIEDYSIIIPLRISIASCVQSAVSLNFQGRSSYALCRFLRYSCIYKVHTSPALDGSSAIWRFKHSDVIEIRNGIILDFYTGLSHIKFFHLSFPFCCLFRGGSLLTQSHVVVSQ